MQRVRQLAWTALVFNVIVILGGALVRATGSGAGCGASWPTCEGQIIPSELDRATAIEFAHRSLSGIALILVLALFVMVRRHVPVDGGEQARQLRLASVWSVVTIIGEALIGAGIVLFEWVADDSSVARTVAVPLHLVNTLLLLASLALVVSLSSWGRPIRWSGTRQNRTVAAGLLLMVLVAASGATAALADTLFPAESLAEGFSADFDSESSFLTRLRTLHPVIAVLSGLLLVRIVSHRPSDAGPRADVFARAVVAIVAVQIAAGVLNVVLLVPTWMQLVHLALADALWVAYVWYAGEALAETRDDVPIG
jgi:cytochrome c oxidase assembly protein subunit 15